MAKLRKSVLIFEESSNRKVVNEDDPRVEKRVKFYKLSSDISSVFQSPDQGKVK